MLRGLAAIGLVAVVAAGCGADDEPPAAAPASSATPGATGTVPVPPPATRSPATPTNAAEPPDSPEPATAPPPSTAGPVTARNLPAPKDLGAGWTTYVDPGGAEAGFRGNNAWTRSRNAHQAAFEALPVGCANPLPASALPTPKHALQGSYRNPRGGPATVLVLRFPTPSEAAGYYDGYRQRLVACGAAGKAQLAIRGLWSEPRTAAVVRAYAGAETYLEVSAVSGSSVALLATVTTAPETETAWSRTTATHLTTVIDTP